MRDVKNEKRDKRVNGGSEREEKLVQTFLLERHYMGSFTEEIDSVLLTRKF